jgi:hypothetical protein
VITFHDSGWTQLQSSLQHRAKALGLTLREERPASGDLQRQIDLLESDLRTGAADSQKAANAIEKLFKMAAELQSDGIQTKALQLRHLFYTLRLFTESAVKQAIGGYRFFGAPRDELGSKWRQSSWSKT